MPEEQKQNLEQPVVEQNAQPQEPVQQEPKEEAAPEPVKEERQVNRDEIYRKYYESHEPAKSEGEEKQEAASGEGPSAPPQEQPKQEASPNIDEFKQEIAELKETIKLLAQQREDQSEDHQVTQEPSVPKEEEIDPQGWVQAYREGNYEEGNKQLAKIVQKYQGDRTDEKQNIMQETVQYLEAQNKVRAATNKVANEHPELASFKSFIENSIKFDLEAAQQNGTIKNYSDYANTYIDALNRHVKSATEIAQSLRATGAEGARVRQEEIISESVVKPNQVSDFGESKPPQTNEAPIDPTQAYLEARKKNQLKRDGLFRP